LAIFIGERDVFALLVLIALDDLIPRDFLAGLFVDAPVAHPGKVALVEQVEVEPT
jgi:hypothetical protein